MVYYILCNGAGAFLEKETLFFGGGVQSFSLAGERKETRKKIRVFPECPD